MKNEVCAKWILAAEIDFFFFNSLPFQTICNWKPQSNTLCPTLRLDVISLGFSGKLTLNMRVVYYINAAKRACFMVARRVVHNQPRVTSRLISKLDRV